MHVVLFTIVGTDPAIVDFVIDECNVICYGTVVTIRISSFLSLLPSHTHTCTHVYAEVQRIYQSRISVINNGQVSVDTFEVIGLASVELGAGPSGASPPTYVFDCNTTLNNGANITWHYNSEAPRFGIGPIPNSPNGRRLSTSGITTSDLGVYTCLDTYTNTNVSINITQGERLCSSL